SRRNSMTTTTASTLRLAVIEGDGIGKEVVPQGLRALRAALEPIGGTVETTGCGRGAGRRRRTGGEVTDEDRAAAAEHDAPPTRGARRWPSTRPSCWGRSGTRGCPRACSSADCS